MIFSFSPLNFFVFISKWLELIDGFLYIFFLFLIYAHAFIFCQQNIKNHHFYPKNSFYYSSVWFLCSFISNIKFFILYALFGVNEVEIVEILCSSKNIKSVLICGIIVEWHIFKFIYVRADLQIKLQ